MDNKCQDLVTYQDLEKSAMKVKVAEDNACFKATTVTSALCDLATRAEVDAGMHDDLKNIVSKIESTLGVGPAITPGTLIKSANPCNEIATGVYGISPISPPSSKVYSDGLLLEDPQSSNSKKKITWLPPSTLSVNKKPNKDTQVYELENIQKRIWSNIDNVMKIMHYSEPTDFQGELRYPNEMRVARKKAVQVIEESLDLMLESNKKIEGLLK